MITSLIYIAAAMAGVVAGIVGVKFIVEPASALRLTIFRPYRGDPWPRGVQEEDGVHFDWTPPKPPPTPVVPSWADVVVSGDVGEATFVDTSDDIRIQEATDQSVEVQRLRAEVHRAPH